MSTEDTTVEAEAAQPLAMRAGPRKTAAKSAGRKTAGKKAAGKKSGAKAAANAPAR